jgi:hypothetical protein
MDIKNDSELAFCGSLDFGDGDDILTIDRNSKLTLFRSRSLDFGDYNDTLVLNGVLEFSDGCGDILNVEKISGSGTVICDSEYINQHPDTLEQLKNAGIKVVNNCGEWGFSTPEEELADNSRAVAVVLDNERDDADIWLCSEKKAESVEYGFHDDTDWIKIIKTADMEDVYGEFYGDTDSLTVTLYNAREEIGVVDWESGWFSLSDLKNCTYYMRFSVTGKSCVSG